MIVSLICGLHAERERRERREGESGQNRDGVLLLIIYLIPNTTYQAQYRPPFRNRASSSSKQSQAPRTTHHAHSHSVSYILPYGGVLLVAGRLCAVLDGQT